MEFVIIFRKKKSLIFLILILSQVMLETLSMVLYTHFFVNLFTTENRSSDENWFNTEWLENLVGSESIFLNLSIIIIIVFFI